MAQYNFNQGGTSTNLGDWNPAVGQLQQQLNGFGAGLQVDSKYGPQTQAAYLKYQNQLGGNTNSQLGANQNYLSHAGLPGSGSFGSDTNQNSNQMTDNSPSPSNNYNNPYLSQVQSLSQLSQGEVEAQNQLNNLQSSYQMGNQNIQDQPVPMGFITGQQQSLANRENLAQIPLQNKLALAQAQRQASLDAAKTGLDYSLKQQELSKPIFGGYGTSGYQLNQQTGQYEQLSSENQPGGGNSGALSINPTTGLSPSAGANDILGYLAKYGINSTRYDMPGLINAVQNGATAQDIISGQANLAGAKSASTTGSGYKFNPATGTFMQPNPSSLSSQSGSLSGGPSSGGGGYSGGSSSQIQTVQQALGIKADGINGPQTILAVKKFQSEHGLTPDGIVGPKTLAALGVSAGGASSSSSASPLTHLSSGALNRLTTGDFRSGDKYSTQQNAIDAEIRKIYPNFNPQIAKANAKAINEQIGNQADVARGITAADDNFQLLNQTFAKTKVNNMSSPLANELNNKLQAGLIGNSDVINFKSAISTLQTEYATILGRGGEVTDAVRKSASNVINGNYSMNDLISLHNYIDQEGKNVINSYSKTINSLVSGGGGASFDSSGGTTGVTSSGIKYTIH